METYETHVCEIILLEDVDVITDSDVNGPCP